MRRLAYMVLLLPILAWGQTTITIASTATEDTYVFSTNPTYNYGRESKFKVSPVKVALIRCDSLYTKLGSGQVVTAMGCSVYVSGATEDGTIAAYSGWKYKWVEGNGYNEEVAGATWNRWDHSNAYEWATAGVANVGDDGVMNVLDDGVAGATNRDCKTTALESFALAWSATWIAIDIDTATANTWYRGIDSTKTAGIALKSVSGGADYDFASTENTTASVRPRWWVTYQAEAAPPAAGGGQNSQIIVVE